MNAPDYAELHCLSDFSFGRGASSARELFERAKRCGYTALAITDECSLAGIVRAHEAARDTGVKLIVGSEIQLDDGPKLVLLVQDHAGYTHLCRLITQGRRAADKGTYRLTRADLADGVPGTLALWIPDVMPGRPSTPAACKVDRIPPALRADPLPAEEGEDCVPRIPGGARAKSSFPVTPAHAWIHLAVAPGIKMDPGMRRDDERGGAGAGSTSRVPLLRQDDERPDSPRAEAAAPIPPCSIPPPSERRGIEGDGSWATHTTARIPPALRADPLPAEGGEGPATQSPRSHHFPAGRVPITFSPERDIQAPRSHHFPAGRIPITFSPEREHGAWLKSVFGDRLWLAVELLHDGDDAAKLRQLTALADELGIPAVAAGDVHMHVRSRRALQDTLTAVRHRRTLVEARGLLFRNGERHLRRRDTLAAIHPEALLAETVRIAARCTFSLAELQYHYPAELVPEGHTPATWLRQLTEQGARWRWPDGVPPPVQQQLEHELALIAELKYEPYFLTVHDIVRFARAQGILCQGRGSAANSAVCFALGITEVDPARINTLVERFISKERNEPPDIDVDFEHQRREEVLQYVYRKYGRERAAITAEVICYQAKSAVRDVAKALGLPPDAVDKLAFAVGWWNGETALDARLVEAGFDPASPLLRRVLKLTATLLGRPRHLSQHVGGFVISDAPLATLVPVENAAMPERTIIQWDKDDLDSLGLLKVDCLALGMLTCVRKCLDLLRAHHRRDLTLATIPAEDSETYAMIGRADTVGVFQIESRAQMAMLPRLRPRRFYDLVIEVAIVRPGPIQGDMIHPYLKRRNGEEPVAYPSEDVREVLERTLGIPLFQEQVMKLAVVAAGYSPGEADQLRRSMAAWRRHGDIEQHRDRITRGMLARGYTPEFSAELFERLKGFGSYGFPESHAASFALIAYASAWLKCHEPATFLCALLNSLPMGFYSESQLTQDARRHGIRVNPVDVRYSDWESTLEPVPGAGPDRGQPALRLGFRLVRGFREDAANRISAARRERAFDDLADLTQRAGLDARDRRLLAGAGALRALAGHRHRARWEAAGVEAQRPLFGYASPAEAGIALAPPSVGEDTVDDYATTGLSLGTHPVRQLRAQLRARRCRPSRELRNLASGATVRAAGLVTLRQRPLTADGVTFVSLEDEDGMVNVVIWPQLAERQRRVLLQARLLGVEGRWESASGVQNLIARRLFDYSPLLGTLDIRSRNFR